MTIKVSFKKTVVEKVIVDVPERYFRVSDNYDYDEIDRCATLFLISQQYGPFSVIGIDINKKLCDNVRYSLIDDLYSEEEHKVHDAMQRFAAAYILAEFCVLKR